MHILVAMLLLPGCSALRDRKSPDTDSREAISWPTLAEMQEKMVKKPHPEGRPHWVTKRELSDESIDFVKTAVWACYNVDASKMASCITWQMDMDYNHTLPQQKWEAVLGRMVDRVDNEYFGPPVKARLKWGDLSILVFAYYS